MTIGRKWNSLSRLNRTRISVAVFLCVVLAAIVAVPVGLMGGVL